MFPCRWWIPSNVLVFWCSFTTFAFLDDMNATTIMMIMNECLYGVGMEYGLSCTQGSLETGGHVNAVCNQLALWNAEYIYRLSEPLRLVCRDCPFVTRVYVKVTVCLQVLRLMTPSMKDSMP